MKRIALALALGAAPLSANAGLLQSFDLQIVETFSGPVLHNAAPQVGPELNTGTWIFDMTSDTTFSITHNPGTGPASFRVDSYVFIGDMHYAGFAGDVDPYNLTLTGGDASDITNINSGAVQTGGSPGMAFNIEGEGSYGTPSPIETWTFSFETDATPVPGPASVPLLVTGLIGLALIKRRNSSQ